MRRAVPNISLETMLASLSENTLKQYECTYKAWWNFCIINKTDLFCASVPMVMQFLSELFNSGASYGTLNSHRSALSLLIGTRIGTDDRLKRLFKGFYRSKPPLSKYSVTWNPSLVLDTLSNWQPNHSLSLDKLTKKLVTLLALCTAQRAQTLSLININNISSTESGIYINITDIIKTSGPGRSQPVLFIPFYEKSEICPAKTLQCYISHTNSIRESIEKLLLTSKKPYKAATPSTISRWIKNTLTESGINTTIFSSHSTRHASTSTAKSRGISLDIIRQTAGWTGTSQTFANFYNRPIISDPNFANTILSTIM